MFSRFGQLRDLLIKVRQEEVKEKFILSAFIGWQMGAGGDKKFGDYLKELGLLEGQAESSPEPQGLSAKEAVAKAEEILRLAKERKK